MTSDDNLSRSEPSPFTDPEVAARKLTELANAFEPGAVVTLLVLPDQHAS